MLRVAPAEDQARISAGFSPSPAPFRFRW